MKYKRALAMSLLLYVSSLIVFGLFALGGGFRATSTGTAMGWYIALWVVYIPLTLGWAKWYFRKDVPNVIHGFMLGMFTVLTAGIIDAVLFVMIHAFGGDAGIFDVLYSDWKFYILVIWVIVLCIFAGWEFDSTYTNAQK